ncbi:ArnT family glycosyltransferase [Halobacterium yunchengense]|uniref:ArnT family glycosyltransferase n=1 Tax=Halobacterium yunchengense TaxID=3108497 RepID=UPI0030090285
MSWFARRRLDRGVAALGLVAAACIFPLQFLVSHVYATTLPVVLGFASVLYLLATRSDPALNYPLPTLPTGGARLLELLALGGIAALFGYGGLVGQRTLAFYAGASAVGTLLFARVLFVDRDDLRPGVVLFGIVALAFAVRFVGLYSVAGYIGIDVWSHMAYVEGIRAQGSLRAMDTKYVASPFYHLLVAATADLTGLPERDALYLSVGVVTTLSTGLVYYGARRFTEPRWALFATAMFAVSAQVVRWGLHVIPTSLGLAFFVVFAVYLARVLQEYRARDVGLLAGAVVAVTLTHQLSAFVTLVVLGLAVLTQLLLHSDLLAPDHEPTNVAGLFAFGLGFVTLDWSVTPYSGESFTTVMLLRLRNTLFRQIGLLDVSSSKNVASTAGSDSATLLTKVIAYVDVFGFLAFLFLAALGSYYVLQAHNRTHSRALQVVTIGVMAAVVLAFPILGVSLFLPGRWYAFMYVPMAVVGALGLRYVVYHVDPRAVAVGLLVFVLVLPAAMSISGAATLDNPVFESKEPRYSFTETEVDAVGTIDEVTNEETPPIYTDAPYTAIFRRTDSHVSAPMRIPPDGRATNELVVYRSYQSNGAPLVAGPNGSTRLTQVSRDRVCSPTRSRLYASGDVSLCRQPG